MSLRNVISIVISFALLPGVLAAQQVEYYHLDALGSVRAVTDESGGIITRHDYYPYGEEWNEPASSDTRRFTGKERDDESGLDYFGARYYGPDLGMFAEVDPAMAIGRNLLDPQHWNRYNYARTNPLSFVDPDGRNPVIIGIASLLGAAVLGVLTTPDYAEAPAPGDPAYPNNPGESAGRLIAGTATAVVAIMALRAVLGGPQEQGPDEPDAPDGGRHRRTFSKDQRERFWENSKDAEGTSRCEYCDTELQREHGSPNSYEADHVDPWVKGGTSTDENGKASCRTCNRSKGSKNLTEDPARSGPDGWTAPKLREK